MASVRKAPGCGSQVARKPIAGGPRHAIAHERPVTAHDPLLDPFRFVDFSKRDLSVVGPQPFPGLDSARVGSTRHTLRVAEFDVKRSGTQRH